MTILNGFFIIIFGIIIIIFMNLKVNISSSGNDIEQKYQTWLDERDRKIQSMKTIEEWKEEFEGDYEYWLKHKDGEWVNVIEREQFEMIAKKKHELEMLGEI